MLADGGIATSSRKKYTAPTTAAVNTGNQANSRARVLASRQPMPIPRKLASRMKLEKYARSRIYAGIQRIRAISTKRTRKDARKRSKRSGVQEVQRILEVQKVQRVQWVQWVQWVQEVRKVP